MLYSLKEFFEEVAVEFPPTGHPVINQALYAFLNEVQQLPETTRFVNHLHINNNEKLKRLSVLDIFVRHFDDALCKIFPEGSEISDRLDMNGCRLPLATHFCCKAKYRTRDNEAKFVANSVATKNLDPRKAISLVSNRVKESATTADSCLDEFFEGSVDEFEALRRDVETLRIVGIVLHSIAKLGAKSATVRGIAKPTGRAKQLGRYRVCDFCFRRAAVNSVYCAVHSNFGHGDKDDDSQYKQCLRGKRSREKKPVEEKTREEIIKSQMFLDQVRALCKLMGTPTRKTIIYPAKGQLMWDLDYVATHPRWEIVEQEWWKFIKLAFPVVSSHLKPQTLESNSWDSAATGIWKDLENQYETTTDPHLVIYVLLAAEDWLQMEATSKVERGDKLNISEEIHRLHNLGRINQTDIAKKLDCSRAYVSQVLKRQRNNKAD